MVPKMIPLRVAAKCIGIAPSTLIKTDVIAADRGSKGKGRERKYSINQVLGILVARELRRMGVTVPESLAVFRLLESLPHEELRGEFFRGARYILALPGLGLALPRLTTSAGLDSDEVHAALLLKPNARPHLVDVQTTLGRLIEAVETITAGGAYATV